VEGRLDRSRDDTYCYEVQVNERDVALARRIAVRFQWLGGGILTEEDFAFFDPAKRGPLRNEGLEFAGVRVENELEMLSLLVRLPREFEPANDSIEVAVVPSGAAAAERQKDAILHNALQHHAPGMFSLEVPYPRKGHSYMISWRPRPGPGPSQAAVSFRAKTSSPEAATGLLGAFRDVLTTRRDRLSEATVALYVPKGDGSVELIRAANHLPQGWRDGGAPAQLSLRTGNALYRHVWWGSPKVALRDRDYDDAFGADEQALAVLPITPLGAPDMVPWGLVRIGMPGEGGNPEQETLEILSLDVLYEAMLSLLQSAARL
jgi:hypothetical protein